MYSNMRNDADVCCRVVGGKWWWGCLGSMCVGVFISIRRCVSGIQRGSPIYYEAVRGCFVDDVSSTGPQEGFRRVMHIPWNDITHLLPPNGHIVGTTMSWHWVSSLPFTFHATTIKCKFHVGSLWPNPLKGDGKNDDTDNDLETFTWMAYLVDCSPLYGWIFRDRIIPMSKWITGFAQR